MGQVIPGRFGAAEEPLVIPEEVSDAMAQLLVEIGLLEFPGDGSDNLRITRTALGALAYLLTHSVLTMEALPNHFSPVDVAAIDHASALFTNLWKEQLDAR